MSTISQRRQSTMRFYRVVFVSATVASIAGNVGHAILNTPAGANVVVAAVIASLPPAAFLAVTEGLARLARTGIAGVYYAWALRTAVVIGCASLALSCYSLWHLSTVNAGIPWWLAWLVPLVIDLSEANASLSLLALSTGQRPVEAERRRPAKRAPAKPRPVRLAAA